MRDIFLRLDSMLASRSKRERVALFCLPLLLCVGVVFAWILPPIDAAFEEATLKLEAQKNIAQMLDIPQNSIYDAQIAELEHKNALLNLLRQKSITNATLAKKLGAFSNNIQIKDAYLSLIALGDVEVLEDLLEGIEENHFVFIENLAISAPFASNLEIKLDVLNFGHRMHK